jgi:hypothetical protein
VFAEKEQLAREAGLTIKQVSDFCGNWRKRKWKGESVFGFPLWF